VMVVMAVELLLLQWRFAKHIVVMMIIAQTCHFHGNHCSGKL